MKTRERKKEKIIINMKNYTTEINVLKYIFMYFIIIKIHYIIY